MWGIWLLRSVRTFSQGKNHFQTSNPIAFGIEEKSICRLCPIFGHSTNGTSQEKEAHQLQNSKRYANLAIVIEGFFPSTSHRYIVIYNRTFVCITFIWLAFGRRNNWIKSCYAYRLSWTKIELQSYQTPNYHSIRCLSRGILLRFQLNSFRLQIKSSVLSLTRFGVEWFADTEKNRKRKTERNTTTTFINGDKLSQRFCVHKSWG